MIASREYVKDLITKILSTTLVQKHCNILVIYLQPIVLSKKIKNTALLSADFKFTKNVTERIGHRKREPHPQSKNPRKKRTAVAFCGDPYSTIISKIDTAAFFPHYGSCAFSSRNA